MRETWIAVIVGLGSGAIAAVVAVVYQRGAEFRTRKLDAAADFLRATEAFRRELRRYPAQTPPEEDFQAMARVLDERWNDLVLPVELLTLLFSERSLALVCARVAGGHYRDVLDGFQERVKTGDAAALVDLQDMLRTATDALSEFAKAAPRDVRWPRFWRMWWWVSRQVTGVGEEPALPEEGVADDQGRDADRDT